MPVRVEHETPVEELHNEWVSSREAVSGMQFLEHRCVVVPSVAADHQPSSSIVYSLQLVDQAIRDAM